MKQFLLSLITGAITAISPSSASAQKPVWVYTSIYKEFAAPLKKAFEAKHPDIRIEIYQAGSEKIQAKLEAELLAKKPQADLLILSDPFWTLGLEKRGLLLQPQKGETIQTNYYSLMVLICHPSLPEKDRPQKFLELTQNKFKDQIQLGSPLESGTTFSTVAYLSHKYGWEYFEKLKENALASSGGNSTVIQKVESGEKKIGIALLENALAAQKRGSPIVVLYPKDGAIPIPSVQAILKTSKSQGEARLFADFVLSKDGQELLRKGYMYSVLKEIAPPEGALPFAKATQASTLWSREQIGHTAQNAKEIKRKFSELILE